MLKVYAILCLAFALFTTAYSWASETSMYTVHVREFGKSEKVTRHKCTGEETVLDVVATIGLPSEEIAGMTLWLARIGEKGNVQILEIDWASLVNGGSTRTNFVIFSGDRIFLQSASPKR